MEERFWSDERKRWDGHQAFNTVTHHHVSCYFPADGHDTCDIMIVGCADGRWYVEDNWGGNLHIVLDDGNVKDSNVQFCLNQAEENGDVKGVELAKILLQMSKTQRLKLYADH